MICIVEQRKGIIFFMKKSLIPNWGQPITNFYRTFSIKMEIFSSMGGGGEGVSEVQLKGVLPCLEVRYKKIFSCLGWSS
jgi:hypothetical protein